ncbi:DUF4133 domain-containing protein [Ilyomonas limi]|uniref:DUF4133 domain-containing protein n=1 Tax=Ilyomonas limi TaxID=2575867 RepID=A0A4U3KVG9_9BACT|nr:DUF4133 domain-containing protein [Ilyomonas limi]TKK66342.1 DUF4133 domain-containing protein [Ilyomonas limi]
MGNTIYTINKGVNKPLEFNGLKAQYIWYLAGGLVGLLILFSIMYIAGLNAYLSVLTGLSLGALLFYYVYKLNNKYGQFGWMQRKAKRSIPERLKSRSRKFLIQH